MWRSIASGALLLVAGATAARAQSTGTPVYQAPYRAFARSEFGVSLSEPGAGFDLEGSVRGGLSGTTDIGVRAGIYSPPGPGTSDALVGVDLRSRLVTHTESFPLDGSATVGLGFQSGGGATVGYLPVGFSMGRRVLIEGSDISLVPYVQPVVTFLMGDATGTQFSLGFGLDARVTPRLDLRFSAAVGNLSGIGFTVAFLH
jgi:hypothetical protein